MKKLIGFAIGLILLGNSAITSGASLEITPSMQTELDRLKGSVSAWAADATIVKAVSQQNSKGPIAGMDNIKWKTIRRSDDVVKEFQNNSAGQYLKGKVAGSHGAFTEAFLSASLGEKVAFVEKTTSYIHKGQAKFDVPLGAAKAWQGKPEFDESAQTYQVQISVPVIDAGRPIGVLVVGVNLTHLAKAAKN